MFQGDKMQISRLGRERSENGLSQVAGASGAPGTLLPPQFVASVAQSAAPEAREDSLLEIIWRQRKFVATTMAVFAAIAGIYLMVATPKYTTSARLDVQKASPGLLGDSSKTSSDQESDNYRYTQCEILKSTPILALAMGGPGMDDLPMFDGVRNRISWLKDQLTADVGKRDDIITLSMIYKDRKQTEKVVDNVVQAYIAYQSNEKRSSAAEVTGIIQKEKSKRDLELEAKRAELKQFVAANRALGVEAGTDRTNVVMARLNSISDALTTAHLNAITAKSAYEQVLKSADMTDEQAAAADVVALSPTDEDRLRSELFAMSQRLEDLKRNYLESHPVVRAVQVRVKQLGVALVSVVRQRSTIAQYHEQELQKAFDAQQKLATDLASKSADYGRLNDEIKRLESQSDNYDNRIKELAVIQEAGALNIRVIEEATSEDKPSSPAKAKVLAGALVIGLMLGAGLGLLREWADPRLSSAEDVKSALGINVIASLPRMPAGQSPEAHAWAVHLSPTSEAADACRAIRTAIMYGTQEGHARTIVVTSPVGGEGKSTIAGNLAIALAKAGKKVIVVDVNFHRPSIHRIFGVNNDNGLAGVMTTSEPIEKAVRRTAVERLDVLPAGELPSSQEAPELFNSDAFNHILDGLSSVYDHVVLDAPAVTVLDDARIVAAACDVTLLVMRLDRSSRRLAEKAREGLVSVGANLIGAIVNDAPRRASAGGLLPGGSDDARPIVQRIAAGLEAERHSEQAAANNGGSHATALEHAFKTSRLRDEATMWNEKLSDVEPHVS